MASRAIRTRPSSLRYYSTAIIDSVPEAKKKYVPTSGTYPQGFLCSGTHVGIRPSNTTHPDLALITSSVPCSAAAVFTKNKFQAAPVVVSRNTLSKRKAHGIRSIIVNSGCANAVTGKLGMDHATSMAATVDNTISPPEPNSTLVMSTGVIGQRLPIDKILSGISKAHSNLSSTHDAWLTTARAICTTDTFPKLLSQTFALPSSPGITYSLAGMCKGAGMIHPNMATLLGILCTDAPVAPGALRQMLQTAVSQSFNAISVDGDSSTNDTLAVLANGVAGGPEIQSTKSDDGHAMSQVLNSFAQSLSHLIVSD